MSNGVKSKQEKRKNQDDVYKTLKHIKKMSNS